MRQAERSGDARSKPGRPLLRAALCCAIALLASVMFPQVSGAASKKDKDEQTSKNVVDAKTAKKLNEAHELMTEEQWAEAREILDEFDLERMKPYPFTLVQRAYGYIDASTDDYANAAKHFAAALSTNTLPASQQRSIRFNLGQIYMMLDEWEKAIETLELWFQEEENPNSIAYYMLGVAYYQNDEPEKALEPAKLAIEKSSDPREAWMRLLLSLYMEQKAYEESLPLLERMVLRYDKEEYWTRLAAVLMELERDRDSLAVQQLAYAKGYVSTDRAITRLAQTFAFNGMPWQGALVLGNGLEDGVVEGSASSWRLYANSLLAARETQMALDPLERAASIATDGNVFVQLSQVYIQNERWSAALSALDHAFEKGDLTNPGHAHLLVGIAAYQAKRYGQARNAFVRARTHENTRDMADRWIQFVDREQNAAQAG